MNFLDKTATIMARVSMQLINGKKISQRIFKRLKKQLAELSLPIKPCLAVVLVGKNPASHLYVRIKERRAKEVGIGFRKYILPGKVKQAELIELIQRLNKDRRVSAILVQLPLPKHLKSNEALAAIDPRKDADGIHPVHLNRLVESSRPRLLPATTGAIIEALKATKIDLKNKSVAIIGKSKIVGLPTYYYLKNKCRQIDIYDKATKNLAAKSRRADVLIVAIGQPGFIKVNYVKPGALVIDVGINKVGGKTVGDVDFKTVKHRAAWLTPVPGGIGPITVARLLKNVLILERLNQKLKKPAKRLV